MTLARILGASLLLATCVFGQDPVHWTLTSENAEAAPGSIVSLKLTAKIDEGWHFYSLTTPPPGPDGGPIAATLKLADNPAVAGVKLYQPKPERRLDPNFKIDVETFQNETVFLLLTELKKDATPGDVELTAQVRYQSCNDHECLPPKKKTAVFNLKVAAGSPVLAAAAIPGGYTEFKPGAPVGQAPVLPAEKREENLGGFALTAFGLGLASIFTPCVFPMIPITVSFFLNQKGGLGQAILFSLGIIVFFCLLGVGVTAAVGPFGVNQLAANPWVNGFIAIIFTAFALSLLGAFEITLPSGLLTKLDAASRKGGMIGTLLMGLTFSLTSFACIGPFMGSLLVASVQSKGVQPVVGMVSFATGLASPFFFLAAFPSYLKKLPRSGGWLARVKVVMGFALLAIMLKYASNIDSVLQTNLLTRERFLAAWFVLSVMAGIYLLGLLRLEGIEAGETLGIPRLLFAAVFLIFGFSLLPGMFGAPLGDLDAYVPAASAAPGGGRATAEGGPPWMKNQYREALDRAKQENKLVLVDFTGYACTNCHWMKANMFPRPEIAAAMKDFVLVELYTDGTDTASEQNQNLQNSKFSTVSLPYYALMDSNENVIATLGSTTNVTEFLGFLQKRPS